MGCALKADRLAVGWNGRAILYDVSFTLAAGRTLAIVGESGCGKSTLLAALAGLRPALAGSVTWAAGDRAVKPKKAMLWQSLALLPWKRVRANLSLPLVLEGQTEVEIQRRTAAMLQEMELTGLEDRFPAPHRGKRSVQPFLDGIKGFAAAYVAFRRKSGIGRKSRHPRGARREHQNVLRKICRFPHVVRHHHHAAAVPRPESLQ